MTQTADGTLDYIRTITKVGGNVVATTEFTNVYTAPPPVTPGPPILPQTGMLWWPVPVLLCAGLLSLLIGISRRRRHG